MPNINSIGFEHKTLVFEKTFRSIVFYVSGCVWEVQSVAFYVSGRLWEAQSVVFYVSGGGLGGPTSNQPNVPGGPAKDLPHASFTLAGLSCA